MNDIDFDCESNYHEDRLQMEEELRVLRERLDRIDSQETRRVAVSHSKTNWDEFCESIFGKVLFMNLGNPYIFATIVFFLILLLI